jgi:hypothetical protein
VVSSRLAEDGGGLVYVTITETISAKTAIKQITIVGLGIFIVVVPSDGVSNHSEFMAFD